MFSKNLSRMMISSFLAATAPANAQIWPQLNEDPDIVRMCENAYITEGHLTLGPDNDFHIVRFFNKCNMTDEDEIPQMIVCNHDTQGSTYYRFGEQGLPTLFAAIEAIETLLEENEANMRADPSIIESQPFQPERARIARREISKAKEYIDFIGYTNPACGLS